MLRGSSFMNQNNQVIRCTTIPSHSRSLKGFLFHFSRRSTHLYRLSHSELDDIEKAIVFSNLRLLKLKRTIESRASRSSINLIRILFHITCSSHNVKTRVIIRVLRIILVVLLEHPSDTYVFTMKMEILLEPTSNKLMVDNRFTLIVLSALRHSDKENRQVRSVLTDPEVQVKMEMEIPRSNGVHFLTAYSYSTYTSKDLMKAQVYVSKLPYKLKDTTICKLKEDIKSMRENDKEERVKHEMDEIETINIELEHKKETIENAAQIPIATIIAPVMFKIDLEPLAPRLLNNRETHIDYLKYTQKQDGILQGIVKQAKAKQPLDNALDFAFGNSCPLIRITPKKIVHLNETTSNSIELPKPEIKVYSMRPKQIKSVGSCKKAKIVESKNSNNSKPNHLWGSNATYVPSSSSLINDSLSRLSSGTVRFENDQIGKIMGYGDYQLGNIIISRVYYVEGVTTHIFTPFLLQ
ncbi:hypothetical protein Tco_1214863 [Tanacetum coccineum]